MSTEPETLVAGLAASAAAHGDAPALVTSEASVSFADIRNRALRVAASLRDRGIRPGDRVGLLCPNGADFPAAYFGILGAGGTVVPLNLLQNPREMAFILRDAGARALFIHPAFAEAAPLLQADSPVEWLAELPGAPAPVIPDAIPWSDFLAAAPGEPSVACGRDDVAAILYTSGTTGQPKGAMLTHGNLLANSSAVAEMLHLDPARDRILLVLPMFHAFAATVGMVFPLLHGIPIIPLPRFEPDAVSLAIQEHQATVFLGVPSMFSVLLRLPPAADARLSPLRFCISGGAAMPQQVMEQFEDRFGIPIYEGDGPTECSPVTAVNPIGGRRKPRTIGLPIPGVEMRILDEQGREQPDGEIGEICVRAPSVMKGYWNRPEETADSFFGDWFRTGDLGTRDEDGYFAIVDRKKDMLIVNGMNVYPRMVEETLYRMPGIREAAVVGEPDELHGEIPIAYVALDESVDHTPADVRAFCREHLGRYEVPRRVVLRGELPKNAAGKILKRELRTDGEWERGVDSRAD